MLNTVAGFFSHHLERKEVSTRPNEQQFYEKSLKRKKFGKNKSLDKKSDASSRRLIMQSLKSIRLAEVG